MRHSTATHLELNFDRGRLGHVIVNTTNRYAGASIRSKKAARSGNEAAASKGFSRRSWRDEKALLDRLDSL
jgi:hypothetical protein